MGQDVIGHTVAPVAAGLCAAMMDGSMYCAGLKEPVRNDLGLQRCVAQSLVPGRATSNAFRVVFRSCARYRIRCQEPRFWRGGTEEKDFGAVILINYRFSLKLPILCRLISG